VSEPVDARAPHKVSEPKNESVPNVAYERIPASVIWALRIMGMPEEVRTPDAMAAWLLDQERRAVLDALSLAAEVALGVTHSTICAPTAPCVRCQRDRLGGEVTRLQAELAQWRAGRAEEVLALRRQLAAQAETVASLKRQRDHLVRAGIELRKEFQATRDQVAALITDRSALNADYIATRARLDEMRRRHHGTF